jgi:Ca2+-binding EF-hand superfamily protein
MPPNRFTPAIRRGAALTSGTLALALASVSLAIAFGSPPAAAQNDNRVPVPLGSKKNAPVSIAAPPILVVEPVAMMIATFDADGDGRVTRDEMRKGVAKSFAAIDTGNTGKLGYIAFSDWAQKWLGDPNALPGAYETDSDSDNQITLAELQAKFDQIFTRLDKDKDGVLTRAELLTIRAFPMGDGGRGKRGRAP